MDGTLNYGVDMYVSVAETCYGCRVFMRTKDASCGAGVRLFTALYARTGG